MITLRELSKKINIRGKISADEPLSEHTTFRVGGPADLFIVPEDIGSLATVVRFVRESGLPFFILGGGANLLVSDRGIRGAVIDLKELNSVRLDHAGVSHTLTVGAGLAISDAAAFAARAGFSGLENFYSMPGSAGGALYMNARCYGRSISEVLVSVRTLDGQGEVSEKSVRLADFAYKESPFQKNHEIILDASFRIEPAGGTDLFAVMAGYKRDREAKGHFLLPSAGSVFKNDRNFGEPTGVLIDRLGLKGYSIGGARVSELHGNIIVNSGSASANDIIRLMEYLERRVFEEYGYKLEREVICVGEWRNGDQGSDPPSASSSSSVEKTDASHC